MLRILMITQHFAPEVGAAATRATELSQLWAATGASVVVLTSMPAYPRPSLYESNGPMERESLSAGVRILRVPGSEGVVGRAVRVRSYFTFVFNALGTIKRLTRGKRQSRGARLGNPDIVLATSGPPLVAGLGAYVARRLGVPLVLEYRDLTYLQMAATGRGGSLARALMQWYEKGLAKMASHLVVVTEGFRRTLVEQGIEAAKITAIPNGILLRAEMRGDRGALPIRESLTLSGDREPNFAYFGTLGLSQDIGEILPIFGAHSQARLLIVGDGADASRVRAIAQRYPHSVVMHGPVPEQVLTEFYRRITFHIVRLRFSREFSTTVPSKLFRIAGNGGLPFFIGPEGEAAAIVRRIDGRLVCHSLETLRESVETLLRLEANEIDSLRDRARNIIGREYNREGQAQMYLTVLSRVLWNVSSS